MVEQLGTNDISGIEKYCKKVDYADQRLEIGAQSVQHIA